VVSQSRKGRKGKEWLENMSTVINNHRIDWVDVAKGIGIILFMRISRNMKLGFHFKPPRVFSTNEIGGTG